MITSRFGGTVKLISPVDWNSGWTVGIISHDDGSAATQREIHTSELKADGGLNEIAAASDAIENNLCCDCHQPMEVAAQEQRNAEPLTIVTCKNRSCSLYSVTLSVQQYWAQTDEQRAAYRTMVEKLKAHMESRKNG